MLGLKYIFGIHVNHKAPNHPLKSVQHADEAQADLGQGPVVQS